MRFSRCLIYQDENHLGQIAMLSEAESGAEGGSRTHTGVTPKVFETFASAIPPLRLWAPGLPFRLYALRDIRDNYTSGEIVFWL